MTEKTLKLYLLIFLNLIIYIQLIFYTLDFFNNNSGAVQAISTMILVGVTTFYALQVRRTNELISVQIFPNISIEPEKLYSNFLDPKLMAKKKIEINNSKDYKSFVFIFTFYYSVSNHSASPGSIEKPQLLIKTDSGKEKVLSSYLRDEVMVDYSSRGEIKNTLYLKARETKNMKDDFRFVFISNKDDLDFINSKTSLKYIILYKNVIGEQKPILLEKDKILSSQKLYDREN